MHIMYLPLLNSCRKIPVKITVWKKIFELNKILIFCKEHKRNSSDLKINFLEEQEKKKKTLQRKGTLHITFYNLCWVIFFRFLALFKHLSQRRRWPWHNAALPFLIKLSRHSFANTFCNFPLSLHGHHSSNLLLNNKKFKKKMALTLLILLLHNLKKKCYNHFFFFKNTTALKMT